MTRFALTRPKAGAPDGHVYFTGRIDIIETGGRPVAVAEAALFEADARTFARWTDASIVAQRIEDWSPNARADRRWRVRPVSHTPTAAETV